jgi:hypothetical protein
MSTLGTRILRPVLVGLIVGVMFGAAISVAYAGMASSSTRYYWVGWMINNNEASVYTHNYTGARAYTWVGSEANEAVGHLGARARLYNDAGSLVKDAGWYYNPWVCAGFDYSTANTSISDNYRSYGQSRGWNGSEYVTYYTYTSPYQPYPE